MEKDCLLKLCTDLGYELAMCGAETFRVEESIKRITAAYGVSAEVFAIPNYILVSLGNEDGHALTSMRRIGFHGNDMDSVEQLSALSRTICSQTPPPREAMHWLEEVLRRKRKYPFPVAYIGNFLGAAGFSSFFGGGIADSLCAGLCGMLVGLIDECLSKQKTNPFFRTIAEAFLMAMLAYFLGQVGFARNPDMVIIGALMLLVPGLLFTNAMRDIIYGDTNSGVNRIVQVLLVAVAICLGTATAWNGAVALWGTPVAVSQPMNGALWQCMACVLGCLGFALLFNIHGPGALLCALGGLVCWSPYLITLRLGGSELMACFWGTVAASFYSEIMARVRKCPAISYLVVSIFPLIPGAGIYYTMSYAVQGDMERFASQGMLTAATAGIVAVGILLVSTGFRLWTVGRYRSKR